MPAPKGHPLWGNPLKPKKYSPGEFWERACAYFEWCDANPWQKVEQKKGNTVVPKGTKLTQKTLREMLNGTASLPTQRPYSIEGLCSFLNINLQTFYNYESREGYETYFDVCARIRQIIDNQHFEGGMVGAFNSNIVMRKLGLAEKQEVKTSGDIEVSLEL